MLSIRDLLTSPNTTFETNITSFANPTTSHSSSYQANPNTMKQQNFTISPTLYGHHHHHDRAEPNHLHLSNHTSCTNETMPIRPIMPNHNKLPADDGVREEIKKQHHHHHSPGHNGATPLIVTSTTTTVSPPKLEASRPSMNSIPSSSSFRPPLNSNELDSHHHQKASSPHPIRMSSFPSPQTTISTAHPPTKLLTDHSLSTNTSSLIQNNISTSNNHCTKNNTSEEPNIMIHAQRLPSIDCLMTTPPLTPHHVTQPPRETRDGGHHYQPPPHYHHHSYSPQVPRPPPPSATSSYLAPPPHVSQYHEDACSAQNHPHHPQTDRTYQQHQNHSNSRMVVHGHPSSQSHSMSSQSSYYSDEHSPPHTNSYRSPYYPPLPQHHNYRHTSPPQNEVQVPPPSHPHGVSTNSSSYYPSSYLPPHESSRSYYGSVASGNPSASSLLHPSGSLPSSMNQSQMMQQQTAVSRSSHPHQSTDVTASSANPKANSPNKPSSKKQPYYNKTQRGQQAAAEDPNMDDGDEEEEEEFDSNSKKPQRVATKSGNYRFRKGWTRDEHIRFLIGVHLFGRGNWKSISNVIQGKSPKQVQSHAQKYFLRQEQTTKTKRSIHDFNLNDLTILLKDESFRQSVRDDTSKKGRDLEELINRFEESYTSKNDNVEEGDQEAIDNNMKAGATLGSNSSGHDLVKSSSSGKIVNNLTSQRVTGYKPYN
nr:unnamed protein product [Naegleria fowleri]